MNKTEFIKELGARTGLSADKCELVNSIIEDTFIIGKNNKNKLLDKLKSALNLDEKGAEGLYEKIMEIVGKEVKNKLKHPFKSLD